MSVDPVERVARAAGGLTWAELDLATQRFGLATTGGALSSVGIGGMTLGRRLRAPDAPARADRGQPARGRLVTADGERLRVDAESEPELLWGLRGGGGNFGIATAFEYDLHPVGPIVLGGPVYWPLEQAPEVLRFLREFAPEAPDELRIMLVAHRAPPLPFLRARALRHARCWGWCWCGAATSPRGCARPRRCARSAPRSPTSCARCPIARCSR